MRIVNIAAPALSAVVIVFCNMLEGLSPEDAPEDGSLFEVAPVRSVNGTMSDVSKFTPMTDNALICSIH